MAAKVAGKFKTRKIALSKKRKDWKIRSRNLWRIPFSTLLSWCSSQRFSSSTQVISFLMAQMMPHFELVVVTYFSACEKTSFGTNSKWSLYLSKLLHNFFILVSRCNWCGRILSPKNSKVHFTRKYKKFFVIFCSSTCTRLWMWRFISFFHFSDRHQEQF